jgi:tRNA-dihydrouridine synthase 3
MSMGSDMADIEDPSEPTSSLKRPLEQDNILLTQPILPRDLVVTKPKKVERSGLIDTNGNHFDGPESAEPESKRVKLDNSEAELGSHKVDARDKVKGVALVKEEYVNKFVHEHCST